MTECFRKRVRGDLDLVYLMLTDVDNDEHYPGWYFQRPGGQLAHGPYASEFTAMLVLPTLADGFVYPHEVTRG
jgi:hypothetical protein